MLQPLAIGGQQLLNGLAGGEDGVLQAHLLFPGLIPPEQRALVGAVDAVQGGDPHVLNGGIGLGAAPGVEEHRIVAPGQGDIVVPGRAHRPQVAHPLHRLEHRHHPGDAPLGGQLIDEVGLGHPQLGQGLFQVVEHNGHRAGIGQVHGAALPGEGIDIGQDGLRLRFWLRLLHGGEDGDGGLVRHGGGRGGGLPLSAGGQQTGRQDQGQQQGEGLFHKGGLPFHPICAGAQMRVCSIFYHTVPGGVLSTETVRAHERKHGKKFISFPPRG